MKKSAIEALLNLSDIALSDLLKRIPVEKFREILAAEDEPPKSEWFMDHDGRQWALRQIKIVPVLGEDKKPTGETKQVEVIVGYFPKFAQALGRMYEGMVGEELVTVDSAEIVQAVEKAKEIAERVCKVTA